MVHAFNVSVTRDARLFGPALSLKVGSMSWVGVVDVSTAGGSSCKGGIVIQEDARVGAACGLSILNQARGIATRERMM